MLGNLQLLHFGNDNTYQFMNWACSSDLTSACSMSAVTRANSRLLSPTGEPFRNTPCSVHYLLSPHHGTNLGMEASIPMAIRYFAPGVYLPLAIVLKKRLGRTNLPQFYHSCAESIVNSKYLLNL